MSRSESIEPDEAGADAARAAARAHARAEVLDAVDVLRGRLAASTFPLEGDGVARARQRRRELLDQIEDYLLPRLRSDGAPLLVVVGGSTGAGKSTLVNSILGAPLARPGVLRPTTRSPLLVHHPSDGPWFAPERILPTLARATGEDAASPTAPRTLRLAPYPGIPAGLALLDAPDIDSVEEANRELAAQLLAAADLWLFVTTAARYADAVPWELLNQAAARHAQVALVIDRVDEGSGEVVADLARLAVENGLGEAPLFVIPEADPSTPLDPDGLLPAQAVAPISTWLTGLAGDPGARERVALATRDGVLADLADSATSLAGAADAQAASAERLQGIVTSAYAQAASNVHAATSDGTLLRGEVMARWQDFVGASDVMRSLERGVSRARDSVVSFFRGGRPSVQPVEQAITYGLEAVTLDAVEGARERVRSAWRSDPAGAALLNEAGATASVTGGSTAAVREAIAVQVRGWQDDVVAVVREQGADRRGLARALSFGVNGLGVALMLTVFSMTGGLMGAEVGIAGGTALLAQKVLEAAFGDDAVRRLTQHAQDRLRERLDGLLAADAEVALTAVAAVGVSSDDGAGLVRAAARLSETARAEQAGRPVGLVRPRGGGVALRGAVTERPGSTLTTAQPVTARDVTDGALVTGPAGAPEGAAGADDAAPRRGEPARDAEVVRSGLFGRLFGGGRS